MKNFKKHIYVFRPSIRGLKVFAQEKDKSLPSLANEEYADNKFVDAANYRVSNSKFK
jgi:hypothetical protein